MLITKAQVFVKQEAVEGTAETLTAADYILAEKPSFKANTPPIERAPASTSFSPFASLQGLRSGSIEFDAELKGSGVRGTPPEFAALLKACGMSEAIVAGESVTYMPVSSSIPSVTVGIIEDGVKKLIWGARGTFTLALVANQVPKFHFVLNGVDYSITDADFLDDVALLAVTPEPFINASFSIQDYAALIENMAIDIANTVSLRKDASASGGHRSAVITSRRPKLTIDPEMVTVATHDFYGLLRAGTEGELLTVLGSTPGNITTITANKVQYNEISEADREGLRTLGITCQLNRDAGDDEFRLSFT